MHANNKLDCLYIILHHSIWLEIAWALYSDMKVHVQQ